VKTTEQYFIGFEEHRFDHQSARIATVEKALVDMAQFHRSTQTSTRLKGFGSGCEKKSQKIIVEENLMHDLVTFMKQIGLSD
jgi:hypothetical protein